MGALILESAFLAQVKDPSAPLKYPATYRGGVEVQLNQEIVAFPDLLLAINSAADSVIAREIEQEVLSRGLRKRLTSPGIDYAAPLLVSITSSADTATGSAWRLGRSIDTLSSLFRPAPYTDGHDPNLRTHDFIARGWPVSCKPLPGVPDFGQDWHCLRPPSPPMANAPGFSIDLPVVSRHTTGGPIHVRYDLQPLSSTQSSSRLAWIFQVPPEIIPDHNDIFNTKSTLLMLAMMQISGAVVSLATDIGTNFEPEFP
jgi:hypothetical protein